MSHKVWELASVQKVAVKIILQERYTNYEQSLLDLNLEKLTARRDRLCLNFAKKCLKIEKTRTMFPLAPDEGQPDVRTKDVYQVQFARTSRLLNSAIPQLQRALNKDAQK